MRPHGHPLTFQLEIGSIDHVRFYGSRSQHNRFGDAIFFQNMRLLKSYEHRMRLATAQHSEEPK